jgi:hypothetical protein
VFNFGTVIARMPEPGAAQAAAAAGGKPEGRSLAKGVGGKSVKAPKGGGGAAGCGAAGGGGGTKGGGSLEGAATCGDDGGKAAPAAEADATVKANVKFTNSGKVPCTVNFTVKPRGALPAGQKFPIDVFPAAITIPPNESQCGAGRGAQWGCVEALRHVLCRAARPAGGPPSPSAAPLLHPQVRRAQLHAASHPGLQRHLHR